jgi:DnaJ-class molecular chaperone
MEVILCNKCEGRGSFLVREHDGCEERTCKKCSGTGRLLTKQYTVEIPYGTKPQQYINADAKIIQTIMELNMLTR